MSLPEIPDGWEWKAFVNDETVTVALQNSGYVIAKRTRDCLPSKWEGVIEKVAADLWADINEVAKLAAKMEIEVIYE